MVPGRASVKTSQNRSAETAQGSGRSGWTCPSTTGRAERSMSTVRLSARGVPWDCGGFPTVPVVRATHCHGRAEPDGEPKAHASTMPERRRVAPRVIRARNRSLRDVAAGLLAASVARRTACRVRPEAEPHPVSHAARRTVAPRRAAGPSRERRGSPLAASPRGMSGRVADIRWRSPLATCSGAFRVICWRARARSRSSFSYPPSGGTPRRVFRRFGFTRPALLLTPPLGSLSRRGLRLESSAAARAVRCPM